jgi:predicted RNA-binding protein with PUA-like domain
MKYWLMKSEPDVFSIDHLKKDKTSWWTGVRNYTARNFMQSMAIGDQILFYHSNAQPSGVIGIAEVSKLAAPDQLQFDKKSEYYAEKATKEKPIWFCTEIKYKSTFDQLVPLDQIKHDPKLKEMPLLKQGRLSVSPVTKAEFEHICKLGKK